MNSIEKIENELLDEFSLFDDWMDKYEYIIEMGKNLPPLDKKYKTKEYKIEGCQSQAWINTKYENGKLIFEADGDAIISKGIMALLLRVLSNQTPQDIVDAKLEFVERIGIKEHLSINRANGLTAFVNRIKSDASKYLQQQSTFQQVQ